MKIIPRVIILLLCLGALVSSAGAATCKPTGICNACKNCKYCKHCSKQGGSCSVCRGHSTAATPAAKRYTRSVKARREFMKQSGYPNGRSGYVIDHIVPIKRGGKDEPGNMQWQTIEEARAKDKWE